MTRTSGIFLLCQVSFVVSFQSWAPPQLSKTRRGSLSSIATAAENTFAGFFEKLLPAVSQQSNGGSVVDKFYQAWNDRDVDEMMNLVSKDCRYEDSSFYAPFDGKDEIERHFRLLADCSSDESIVVDEQAVSNDGGDKVVVLYHIEKDQEKVPNSRHCAFFTVQDGLITSAFENCEPASKTGNVDLSILSAVGKLISRDSAETKTTTTTSSTTTEANNQDLTVPEQYFAAWNQRDMDTAINTFTEDCKYDDTVFPSAFEGIEALKKHLVMCEESLPQTFRFVSDDIADGGNTIGVKWHVENSDDQMPFSRGCSIYKMDPTSGLLKEGIDTVEPAVLKLGPLSLFANSMKGKFSDEPFRLLPTAIWTAYMYIVFFSDGILPGANALQLEQRTWEEVRDLSLNFFLVSPLLNLPFSPVVHPILEGVFNLLLAWAALFAGFLSDERKDKPNLLPFIPIVVGMQFLTSAFLLPYLATRTSEKEGVIVQSNEISGPAQVAESRLLGPFLGIVGGGALVWGAFARAVDFGDWSERVTSFWQLMSIDRVGSSFLVDLAIFALFQGWLVDDDLRRRGVADDDMKALRNVAKSVPFFGMAAYMALRPSFSREE